MKSIFKYIFLVAFLSMIWNAQATLPVAAATINSTQQSTEYASELCHAVFNIEAPAIGNYYIRFWLNPTTSDNLTFESHKVVINDEEIGFLTPTSGGWQSIGISGTETVMLYQGENEIRVEGDAISTPMIDMIRISEDAENAEITPSIEVESVPIGEYAIQSTNAGLITDGHNPLTVYYSFNKQMTLRPNQIVTITTTGSSAHGIDLFLYRNTDEVNTTAATNDLNWYGISAAYSSTSTNHRATLNAKIPVLGRYIVKLRSGVSGTQQTISNLTIIVKDSINDTNPTIYTYTNSKASFTRIQTTIPSDGTEYRVSALHLKEQLGQSISMDVCVEGDASEPGRVVRYVKPSISNASYWTGTIDASYQIAATGLHASISNSLATSATCYIAVGEVPAEIMEMQAAYSNSTETIEIKHNNSIVGVDDSRIIIQKSEENQYVEVYNLNGTLIYIGISSEIPIRERGIYIVRIGDETHKVVL